MSLLCDGIHLTSDTSLEELRAGAKECGLRLAYEQVSAHTNIPHYDVWARPKERALQLAEPVTTKELNRRAIRLVGGRPVKADVYEAVRRRRAATREREPDAAHSD